MPLISPSMPDAAVLSPEQKELLARWYPVVVERCRAKLRDPYAADDVAHSVMERLIRELVRGKGYTVEYGVVVHKVIGWKVKEHFAGQSYEAELDAALAEAADDPFEEPEDADLIRRLVADLPDRQREVATLRLLDRLEPDEIAERLGITRNAVDQAWSNAKRKLREKMGHG